MNFITYFCSKIITNHLYHYTLSTMIDDVIPLVPIFIIVYILAYVQWIVGYIVIARESKKVCYKYLSAELIAKFICLILFFLLPTTMVRPEIRNQGLLLGLVNFIYMVDAPVNLFPSIHCLESWLVFRGSLACKKVPNMYKLTTFIFSILVCLSTVFVKQHLIVDICGGIIVVEIGILLSNKFNMGIIYEKINTKLLKNKDDKNEKI
ncbi:MAG: phosphatase PAP2 family protein [Erysipelotrichales bacterium]|nr:phosphatase PAP2 family protein [Erysipelotrichales bacterium]